MSSFLRCLLDILGVLISFINIFLKEKTSSCGLNILVVTSYELVVTSYELG